MNFDLKQIGVAGVYSWGAKPDKQYSIPDANYEFNYSVEPVFISIQNYIRNENS